MVKMKNVIKELKKESLKTVPVLRIGLLVLTLVVTAMVSQRVFAQDDISVNDDEILTPSGSTGSPPPVLDDGDAGVSDVEEYDG
jgi:hypothetical protein